jgi:hypothetical protein
MDTSLVDVYQRNHTEYFNSQVNNYDSTYLPVFLTIPLVMMLISLCFFIRWIRPMEQITQVRR